ncbi:hypothetical protein [Nitratidesulfovibrio liaohensis]|uniref:Uncharacterized protein n=1 Tax=Nitratidesulfovibrio liaohensis TaxID=2604158 RepID=A0ABY9R5P0_9BACT|nr:hypothetical protein [Nitratidesulfovibrio liaohensis]WMW67056.1 hypothetical protein KPS_001701 [Nitratidesulfovibrio liaohensis]
MSDASSCTQCTAEGALVQQAEVGGVGHGAHARRGKAGRQHTHGQQVGQRAAPGGQKFHLVRVLGQMQGKDAVVAFAPAARGGHGYRMGGVQGVPGQRGVRVDGEGRVGGRGWTGRAGKSDVLRSQIGRQFRHGARPQAGGVCGGCRFAVRRCEAVAEHLCKVRTTDGRGPHGPAHGGGGHGGDVAHVSGVAGSKLARGIGQCGGADVRRRVCPGQRQQAFHPRHKAAAKHGAPGQVRKFEVGVAIDHAGRQGDLAKVGQGNPGPAAEGVHGFHGLDDAAAQPGEHAGRVIRAAGDIRAGRSGATAVRQRRLPGAVQENAPDHNDMVVENAGRRKQVARVS